VIFAERASAVSSKCSAKFNPPWVVRAPALREEINLVFRVAFHAASFNGMGAIMSFESFPNDTI